MRRRAWPSETRAAGRAAARARGVLSRAIGGACRRRGEAADAWAQIQAAGLQATAARLGQGAATRELDEWPLTGPAPVPRSAQVVRGQVLRRHHARLERRAVRVRAVWCARQRCQRRDGRPSSWPPTRPSRQCSIPPLRFLRSRDVAPGTRCLTLEVEISRELVPLRNAYRAPGQKAAIRLKGGFEYHVTGARTHTVPRTMGACGAVCLATTAASACSRLRSGDGPVPPAPEQAPAVPGAGRPVCARDQDGARPRQRQGAR